MIPFALTPPEDRAAIANAVGASSSILNVSGQLANGLMPMQGLVRLAPETLSAIQAGAKPLVSGGSNIGTLAQGGKISAQIRWLPVSGVTAVGLVAAIGPALAMVAMQAQLSEISGMARENLQLTETVLNTGRRRIAPGPGDGARARRLGCVPWSARPTSRRSDRRACVDRRPCGLQTGRARRAGRTYR